MTEQETTIDALTSFIRSKIYSENIDIKIILGKNVAKITLSLSFTSILTFVDSDCFFDFQFALNDEIRMICNLEIYSYQEKILNEETNMYEWILYLQNGNVSEDICEEEGNNLGFILL